MNNLFVFKYSLVVRLLINSFLPLISLFVRCHLITHTWMCYLLSIVVKDILLCKLYLKKKRKKREKLSTRKNFLSYFSGKISSEREENTFLMSKCYENLLPLNFCIWRQNQYIVIIDLLRSFRQCFWHR